MEIQTKLSSGNKKKLRDMKKKKPRNGAVSLLNSSVEISRSLEGDDAYVTDNIVTAVFSLCFWPLVVILIERQQ